MKQPTHYLTATIAVDFTKVFSPEHIQGVKFMLGTDTDEEVINILANNIIIDMKKSLVGKDSYTSIVEAKLDAVPENVPEHTEGQDEEDVVPNEIEEAYAELYPDTDDEEYIDKDVEEEPALLYDEYAERLIKHVTDDMFSIESHLGSIISLYLREHYTYADTVANEIGEDVEIRLLKDLEEVEGVDGQLFQDQDYVIGYKDVTGEVKYGKRNINKKEELEEESV